MGAQERANTGAYEPAVFVPGPAIAQDASASQPPLAVAQALMGVHVVPSPLYPALQTQDAVPGPVGVQAAVAAQPPLAVAQASTPVQVLPSPV
jgi:hypothetical protein